MTEAIMPENVIEAIAAVMRDLPAIGKDSEVQGDGPRYKFRGIEAITAVAQDLLGKYGLVFVPRVVGMQRRDISVGSRGAVWDEYQVTVEYDVYGPGGVTDMLPQPVRILQLGRDNSDKGMAKAMTMAYKTALVQVFCIGDSKNDADGERHENADTPPLSQADKVRLRVTDAALEGPARNAFARFLVDSETPTASGEWTDAHAERIGRWLDHLGKTGEAVDTLAGLDGAPETPPVAPVSPVGATEGVTAPEPAPNAEMDGRVAAATAYVKSLDSAQLLVEFANRNLRAPRPVGEQRVALTAALVADDSWVPPQETML